MRRPYRDVFFGDANKEHIDAFRCQPKEDLTVTGDSTMAYQKLKRFDKMNQQGMAVLS